MAERHIADRAPSWIVRPLSDDDAEASHRLGSEAFGMPPVAPTTPAVLDRKARSWFGLFDRETLVARLADRHYDSYYGGSAIPTAGIAGVTVAAEYRGRKALGPLFAETLRQAKGRGAAISTLFPTAPRIYRRFGYECVAEFVTVQVPTRDLADVPPPESVTVRRATASDIEAIRAVYDAWASQQNGPLTRRGGSFDTSGGDYLSEVTAVTVAVDDSGKICGYTSWNRGQGHGETAKIGVDDLLGCSADSYRALLRMLGSHASVCPTTAIDTSGDDLARLFLPSMAWTVVDASPYMLRVLDVVAALEGRRYSDTLNVTLSFEVTGDPLELVSGCYELTVQQGQALCRRVDEADHQVTCRGLGLLYAGTQSAANLRIAGLLEGGADDDLSWDVLFGGRQRHIRNYF